MIKHKKYCKNDLKAKTKLMYIIDKNVGTQKIF